MGGMLWNIGAFIIALGLLIAVHEFGHFWVARRFKVRVERFSIGFGKTLWRRVGKDGTEYILALIPLGGYVKMLDGRVDTLQPGDEQYAFNHQSVWARMAIVAAGPLANFIFAIFALWLIFMIGVPGVKPVIAEVVPNSIVANAGVPLRAEIVEVGDKSTPTWESVTYALISHLGDESVTLTLQLPHTTHRLKKTLLIGEWRFDPDRESPVSSLGIIPLSATIEPVVTAVIAGSASERAGVEINDRIVQVDGKRITQWAQFVAQVQRSPGEPLELLVARGATDVRLTLIPDIKTIEGKEVGFVGLSPTQIPLPDEYRILLQYGPLDALWYGLDKTWSLISLTFDMMGKLVLGIVSLDNLSGPISIAKGAGSSADYGLVYFLSFLALISVNLGIMNLFPLPVLDGGHLLYFIIEGIMGKPLPDKIQEVGFRIGAAILMLLMGIALFNDFARL